MARRSTGTPAWAGLFLAICLAAAAWAHSPSTSYVRIAAGGDEATLVLSLNWSELALLPALDENKDRILQQPEVDRQRHLLEQRLKEALQIQGSGAALSTRLVSLEVIEGGHLEATWLYSLPADRAGLRIRSRLHEVMTSSHVTLVKISAGPRLQEAVLHQGQPQAPFDAPSLGAQAAGFLWLGIRHIFTGYDHVLFLLGLLVIGGTLLELVKIVTSFTVAHSITLAVATLGAVRLPPRFVESAIALSICYIAAENILFQTVARRWVITFLFGLVHGFGFSVVLRELELPRPSLATSLVFFNLGVEIGQVAIVLLALPLVALLSRSPRRRQLIVWSSSALLAVGSFWFIERTFLS